MEETLLNLADSVTDLPPPGVIERFIAELPEKALRLGLKVILVTVFALIGTQCIRIIRKILKRSLTKAGADLGLVQFMDAFSKAVLYFMLIFLLLSSFGVDAASIVAVVGSLGLTVGLALQGSLSNFAGGVLILLLKPFKVGDYIIEDSSGHDGVVKEIQLFYTKLATGDNRIVVIPNGALSNSSLINVSGQTTRRVDILVGISYDADIRLAKELMLSLIQQEEAVLTDQDICVYVDSLGDSAVMLGCRFWVESGNYMAVKWRYTENLKYRFDEAGIEIPYNQLTVRFEQKADNGEI